MATPVAAPEPTLALAQAAASARAWASVQLANFFVLNTRFLSKWITADFVANGASAGLTLTFMSTASVPTDFGLAAVPALPWASLTSTVWPLWTAWASPAVPIARISAPAVASTSFLRNLNSPGKRRGTGVQEAKAYLRIVKLTD